MSRLRNKMPDTIALYKHIIEKQKQEDAAFRANHPTLIDLWEEVEQAEHEYYKAKEKYAIAEKLIKEST